MQVLITGGAGFLGSHLSEALLDQGHQVTVLDTAGESKIKHLFGRPGFRFIPDSVIDRDLIDGLVYLSEVVFHMAAVVGVENYVADPFLVLNVNINGTQNVLRAAMKYHRKVIFTSTSEVYGKSRDIPFQEQGDRLLGSTDTDRWCYSTSKAAGEHFCHAYRQKGLEVVILRYFNIYGPRLDMLDRGRVVTIFLGQALRNEPITVIEPGSQTRTFCYVSDAMRATIKAGMTPDLPFHTFNIGTTLEISMLELAERIRDITGATSEIRMVRKEDVYGDSYEDIPRRVPDNSRMLEVLGIRPEVELDLGLRRTVEYFRGVIGK